jgi:HSP20 family molecular chaperone IbpA
MDRLFEDFLGRRFGRWWPSIRWPETRLFAETEMIPSVDIFEDKDDIVVKAEIPGNSKG